MKILIIQIKQLGDVLLSTPVAEAIKYHLNNAEVHFLTSEQAKDILTLNPFIDKIHTIKKGVKNELKTIKIIRKEKFDAILDIQRTGRSKRITLLSGAKIRAAFDDVKDKIFYNTFVKQETSGYTAFERLDILKAIGIISPKRLMPKLFFSEKDKIHIESYLKNKNIKKKEYFVISPTARRKEKMWSAEEFGKTAKILEQILHLKPIIAYGSDSEKAIAEKVGNFSDQALIIEKPFSIKQFAALLSFSAFFIGNDSFASHVATTQNTKTVVICGPTKGWFPENENTLLIYKGLKCQPCGSYYNCPYNLACYKTLSHKEVFEKILSFLKKTTNS